ncbi:uncharacterized protein LOC106077865 isoform X1 [Biomphalaria glabrata]|uniref:Uncharacterized protein LOC106077865 isoform X1 n=2 Tax=Biomphalaria glabrata TaxID=6526 RepID=A0A9W2YYA3_BIOGL|nr:uncharacterized protein LOC106077865 isoform X1 [Biomphalaria glabrata]
MDPQTDESMFMLFCITSVFFTVGVPSNILSIKVLRCPRLGKNNLSTILCSHCIFSIMTLLTYTLRMFIMAVTRRDPAYHSEQVCGAWISFGHYFISISSWHQAALCLYIHFLLTDKNRPLLNQRETFFMIVIISFLCAFYVFNVGFFGIHYISSRGVFVMCHVHKILFWNVVTAMSAAVLPGTFVLLSYSYLGYLYHRDLLPKRMSYGIKSLIEELTTLVIGTNLTFLLTTFPVHLYSLIIVPPSWTRETTLLWIPSDSKVSSFLILVNQVTAFGTYYFTGRIFHRKATKLIQSFQAWLYGSKSRVNKSSIYVRNSAIQNSMRSDVTSMSSLCSAGHSSEMYKQLLEDDPKQVWRDEETRKVPTPLTHRSNSTEV